MFELIFTRESREQYDQIEAEAQQGDQSARQKSSKQQGLLKQVKKTLSYLSNDPRHNSLQTHKYQSLTNPYDPKQPVFEAYVQNNTPAAYRVFWCYGPEQKQITIISITEHP